MADLNANGWRMAANGRACGAKSSKLTTSTQPTPIQKLQCHLDYIQDSVNKMSGAHAGANTGNGAGNAGGDGAGKGNGGSPSVTETDEEIFNSGTPITKEEKKQILTIVFNENQENMDKWEIKKLTTDPPLIIFKNDSKITDDPNDTLHYYEIVNDQIVEKTSNSGGSRGGRRRNRKRKTSKRKSSKKTHNKKAKSSKRR